MKTKTNSGSKKVATVVLRGRCEDCGKRTQQTVAKKNAGSVLGLICKACAPKYAEPRQLSPVEAYAKATFSGDPVAIAAALAVLNANSFGAGQKQIQARVDATTTRLAAAAIAAEMKACSHLGELEINQTAPEFLAAIAEMLAAGFAFSPEQVKLICWPEDDSTLRVVPGYEKLGSFLNAYYE